jgi:drug/metabolite transporter (DMT)-like permease
MKKYYWIMLFAAVLAAVNVPFSKYLLPTVPPLLLAALTYGGGTLGLALVFLFARVSKKDKEPLLHGKDWLTMLAINISDSAANAMLFYGISLLNGETAALLQSFEIVSTALIAFFFFKEKITWRLWLAIVIVVAASVLLSFNPAEAFAFNWGALLILGTTILWGLTNNLCKTLAKRDPIEYSLFKCLGPSVVLLTLALALQNFSNDSTGIALGMLDGFLAYGISVILMVVAFRYLPVSLGTSLYSTNPFIGAIFALAVFPAWPAWTFYVALGLLVVGELLAGYDGLQNEKKAALQKENPPTEDHSL